MFVRVFIFIASAIAHKPSHIPKGCHHPERVVILSEREGSLAISPRHQTGNSQRFFAGLRMTVLLMK
jgi:hypothetical protein